MFLQKGLTLPGFPAAQRYLFLEEGKSSVNGSPNRLNKFIGTLNTLWTLGRGVSSPMSRVSAYEVCSRARARPPWSSVIWLSGSRTASTARPGLRHERRLAANEHRDRRDEVLCRLDSTVYPEEPLGQGPQGQRLYPVARREAWTRASHMPLGMRGKQLAPVARTVIPSRLDDHARGPEPKSIARVLFSPCAIRDGRHHCRSGSLNANERDYEEEKRRRRLPGSNLRPGFSVCAPDD
jgi:hypothetical protein